MTNVNLKLSVVSHFSSDLTCFGLNNIDWGWGEGEGDGSGIVCKKTVTIHLQSKTTCVPTTSESDCRSSVMTNGIFRGFSTSFVRPFHLYLFYYDF